MTDISKCRGKDCPLKKRCWRFIAPASSWQSMIAEAFKDGECENFWNRVK